MALDPTLVVPKRLAALPSAGAFVGELVVLSGTAVIYRWNGTSWVADGSGGGGGGGLSDGTYGDIIVSGAATVFTVGAGAVSLAKMANLATARFIGRVTGSTGAPEAMTGTQATSLLDAFTSAAKGLAPASGGGTANFLRADGTWASPSTVLASSVAFTDGDTLRRVSVSDAALTSSSKIVASITRPDQATDGDDLGFIYIANVVRRYTGGCDLLIAALGWGSEDPAYLPPNETITVVLQVS